jgi:hypothetical protein
LRYWGTDLVNSFLTTSEGGPALRRSAAERVAWLRQRKARIENQLAAIEARDRAAARKRDTRRKIIVGAAALTHAERDPGFRDALKAALRSAVSRPVDQAAIADLVE